MAVSLTHISSTTSSVTLEVWHNNTGGSRVYWDYYSGGQWLNRTYTLVSSGGYGQYTFTSLSSGTYYSFRVRIVNGSTLAELQSTTTGASTSAPQVAPSTPYFSSAYAVSQTGVYLSWSASSGTSYYELYLGYPFYETKYVYGTSFTWTGLSHSTTYYWQVKAVGTNGLSSSYSSQIGATTNSPPVTSPPSGFSLTASSSTSITASWWSVSGAVNYEVSFFTGTSGSYTTSSTSRSITGLLPNTYYGAYVKAYSYEGGWSTSSSSAYVTTPRARPSNFTWTSSKNSNSSFNITAVEWNGFLATINSFRVYKNLSNYSFTTASRGASFTANQYNEVRNAISAMNPSTSIPTYRGAGEIIYASDINRLRDSLNSVT